MLNRIDPNDKDKRKKINRLAEKLVECAIEDKQGWAFQQIADRLEGKPVQVVDATVNDHRTLHQFSDAELTAILRRRVGIELSDNSVLKVSHSTEMSTVAKRVRPDQVRIDL